MGPKKKRVMPPLRERRDMLAEYRANIRSINPGVEFSHDTKSNTEGESEDDMQEEPQPKKKLEGAELIADLRAKLIRAKRGRSEAWRNRNDVDAELADLKRNFDHLDAKYKAAKDTIIELERKPATMDEAQARTNDLQLQESDMDQLLASVEVQRAEMDAQRAAWAEQRETIARLEATVLQQQQKIAELQEQLKKRPRPEESTSDDDSAPVSEPKKKLRTTTNNPPQQRTPKPSTSAARDEDDIHDEEPNDAQTAMDTDEGQRKPRTRIPPVVMRNKDDWTNISKELVSQGFNYTKARLVTDGIEIHPAKGEDHRGITRLLDQKKVGYHTYSLPEEQSLRVVVRGIPDGVTDAEVKADLINQGYAVQAVHRMTHRATKSKMPLVLVKMPLGQESILQVTRCCALVVRVERQRTTSLATQCHRCQRFGHAQSKCTAVARCVKCGSAHRTGDCPKPREEPAKCANCQGAHTASYRGCPSFPKPHKKLVGRPATTTPGPRRTRPAAQNAAVRPEAPNTPSQRSYAQATTGAPTTTNTVDMRTHMATAMTAMQQMMQTMMSLMANISG